MDYPLRPPSVGAFTENCPTQNVTYQGIKCKKGVNSERLPAVRGSGRMFEAPAYIAASVVELVLVQIIRDRLPASMRSMYCTRTDVNVPRISTRGNRIEATPSDPFTPKNDQFQLSPAASPEM